MDNNIITPPIDSEEPIKEYFRKYGAELDSYICLSPFLKWPEHLVLNQFPASNSVKHLDPQLLEASEKETRLLLKQGYAQDKKNNLSWEEIIFVLGFKDFQYLYQALIYMFSENLSDEVLRDDCEKLKQYLEKNNISIPGEGSFPEVYKPLFKKSFKLFGYTSIYVADCFGFNLVYLSVDDLLMANKKKVSFRNYSYFSEDLSLSYTGPMDSYFSILTASKDRIETILEKYHFEGFYADDSTTCRWGLDD